MKTTLTSPALTLTATLFVALSAVTPASAQQASPDDGGCDAAIARWQAFATEENQGGHMDDSVLVAIQNDIGRAAASCRAGRGTEALRLVAASKRRHGY